MTPGFDTNGDEFVPEIDMKSNISNKEASTGLVTLSKDPVVMSANQPQGDSDVDKYPEIPCTIRSGLSASNPFSSIPVIEESNIGSHLVQDSSIVATSKTVIAAANISVEEALFNNELKETNLNKQETTSAVSQLKETNLSKDTGFEKLPEGMNTNNTSQDEPMGDNSPKKFVQKLKLRAVTSQVSTTPCCLISSWVVQVYL
uniref:Uncharacterized protein n=1 Tax=Ciona savignyi TaxID=51511 RepID=H2Y812_CIOSA